jgi:ADP-heptose:LPS heptosyltransferase
MKQIRVLISRPDRIGDVVLSTPLPREIKKKYPGCFIGVMLRPYTKDIYINNPYIDKIILFNPLNNKYSFWGKVKEIRKFRFTHALMLLPNERINWLLFFSGIRIRVGVGHKLFQFLTFTKYVSRKKYIPLRHEADYCMDLARKIGVETDNLDVEIHLSEEEKKIVQEKRKYLAPANEIIIGVHSSSGNSSANWEPVEYLKLINKLKSIPKTVVVVTDNVPPQILDEIEGVHLPNKNKILREAILNIAALDLLVSASTGPMHLAAALKVKTLSLFCPLTACSPKLWGPMGNESQVLLPEEGYCQIKCPGDPKKCTLIGEGGINYLKVVEKIIEIINSRK